MLEALLLLGAPCRRRSLPYLLLLHRRGRRGGPLLAMVPLAIIDSVDGHDDVAAAVVVVVVAAGVVVVLLPLAPLRMQAVFPAAADGNW